MGVVKITNKRRYWLKMTMQKLVTDSLPRNRFEEILRILHFSDNSTHKSPGEDGYNKYKKIQPLVQHLRGRFQAIAIPEATQSIDEAMTPFKGRAPRGLKVYMKNKPVKWGYKIWTRAGISGYVYDFEPYGMVSGPPGKSSASEYMFGEAECVVLRLTEKLDVGHVVAFDNYFASPELLLEMRTKRLNAICTMRQNRTRSCPLMAEKDLRRLGRGSFDYRVPREETFVICKWYDNRPVIVASNYHSVLPADPCIRWDKGKRDKVQVTRPAIVQAYNESMGGVDKSDMIVLLCRTGLKSRKWYLRIVQHLINISVANAWLLHRSRGGELPLADFRMDIAYALLLCGRDTKAACDDGTEEVAAPPMKKTRPYVPEGVRFDRYDHWPELSTETSSSRCKLSGCSGKSKFFCSKCKVALCIVKDCFRAYHTEL